MTLRRALAALAVTVVAACGSGSGTDEDRGVPAGPDDAGTTASTTTPTPYGGEP
ncbi:MAG TPA: hypothetical protein VHF47_01305 [Acidimicrobiales bacterium]|nr:hypothetical protein [Acidimicrobiales bacterium]